MKIAPLRANETTSLSHLNDLDVLDSEPEQAFQALVEVASTVCGTPISLISLIDTDRQWFKANLGLPGRPRPRAMWPSAPMPFLGRRCLRFRMPEEMSVFLTTPWSLEPLISAFMRACRSRLTMACVWAPCV